MKKAMCFTALCVLLCLLAGCTAPSEPPTLTPTLHKTRIVVEHTVIGADGTQTQNSTSLYDTGEADGVRQSSSLTDHKGDEVTFTLGERDPDTLSAVVSFDKPLMQDGVEVTSVTVSRDKKAVLSAVGENGATDTFTLSMHMNYSRAVSVYMPDIGPDMMMCYSDGVLLTLYPEQETDQSVFTLTAAHQPDAEVRGTYALTEDTLTLYEDAGLSITTFRRDERHKAWRYDADASARHALALMPELADGKRLSFGFSYELSRDIDYIYEYRITDFDGQTLLSQKELDAKVAITPLSPTMLRIEADGSTCYLNTETGECSASYNGVLADSPTHTVFAKDDQLIVEELGGEYTRYIFDTAVLDGFKGVSSAMLDGDMLTVLYRDAEDALQAGRLNWRTGEVLPSCSLAITGLQEHYRGDAYALCEDSDTFVPTVQVTKKSTLFDGARLYYCGIDKAAVLFDGTYMDIPSMMRSYEPYIWSDDHEVYNAALTASGIEAQLKADVAAGLAVVETQEDGKMTVYRYKDMSRYHAVAFAETDDGLCVYIGDADAARRHLMGGEETDELTVKVDYVAV